jgi:hypothetical protein
VDAAKLARPSSHFEGATALAIRPDPVSADANSHPMHPLARGHLKRRSATRSVRPAPFPAQPPDQLFLTVRAIAPTAGASVSHSPMVTTIDVT